MKIEVGLDVFMKYGSFAHLVDVQKEINPSEEEVAFMDRVFSFLPTEAVVVERRSNDYISLICGNNDFLRFKLSPRTKWLSLNLPFDLRDQYKESPLFAAQKKKTVIQWKAALESVDDVDQFKNLIIASCRPAPEA